MYKKFMLDTKRAPKWKRKCFSVIITVSSMLVLLSSEKSHLGIYLIHYEFKNIVYLWLKKGKCVHFAHVKIPRWIRTGLCWQWVSVSMNSKCVARRMIHSISSPTALIYGNSYYCCHVSGIESIKIELYLEWQYCNQKKIGRNLVLPRNRQ